MVLLMRGQLYALRMLVRPLNFCRISLTVLGS